MAKYLHQIDTNAYPSGYCHDSTLNLVVLFDDSIDSQINKDSGDDPYQKNGDKSADDF